MNETKFALHIHTNYSDGNASHKKLVEIAADAGLDGIITTDHNILVKDLDGYYGEGKNRTLLIVGEEVHDRWLVPPGNHLLIIGADQEMSPFASDPQQLIDQARRAGGLTFLAHPIEHSLDRFNEQAYPWRAWQARGFSGIELWNQMSEYKSVSQELSAAVRNALFPKWMSIGPLEETLTLWDHLITSRRRPIIAIGGVDAHEIKKSIGPFRIRLYPYLHHFKSVRTHILTSEELSGDIIEDRKSILDALKLGHCFVAYDLPAPTDGFRFSVNNQEGQFIMGDRVKVEGGLTFQIRLPQKNLCRLLKDGKIVKEWSDRQVCTHITTETGVYRVEVYIPYKRKQRGWIFSNPIYAWD